ncbi:MAG: cytochrome C [Candidatus Rokuibacteriota bacterium]|nr:MAG: cytochrome C [Candidatus Rokubacteria bacterium]
MAPRRALGGSRREVLEADSAALAALSGAALLVGLGVLLGLAGCGPSGSPTALERGRQVYQANCTSCHALDPAQDGPVGPAVKGSSQELLETRVLRGTYPPGYTPKRPSAIMQPLPNLAGSIPDLAAYLK